MVMTKVTSKGQITIPKELRVKFDILTGSLVDVMLEDNKIVIKKKKMKKNFFGACKDLEFDYNSIKKGWKEWNEKANLL